MRLLISFEKTYMYKKTNNTLKRLLLLLLGEYTVLNLDCTQSMPHSIILVKKIPVIIHLEPFKLSRLDSDG